MTQFIRPLQGQNRHIIKTAAIASATLLVFLLISQTAATQARSIAETFDTDNLQIRNGLLVSVDKENPEKIELATLQNNEYIIGAVTEEDENTVIYKKSNQNYSVAVEGDTYVYVTDANGAIEVGDFIGASWIEGVGMKNVANTSNTSNAIGVALESFTDSQGQNYGLIDTNEGQKEVSVGYIKIRLLNNEGDLQSLATNTGGIEGFVNQLTGKEASFAKILVGSIVFVMSILLSGFFVSSSIRGSFISIGRNPLASASIYRSLIHITSISVAIILIGTSLTYVILVI